MRLLTYNNRGELQITRDLAENEIPRYAILSHTWSADDEEEVTFRELRTKSYKTKVGYAKIESCGQQAQRDGWQHFWLDTCCINKTDHVELSMAITSMYRWYEHAQVCYVYLADVSTRRSRHGSNTEGQSIDPSWRTSFRRSRWFTRGWTLQELLAPKEVVFYSKQWHRLGTRTELRELLHEITGIPTAALNGKPPSQFSVIERMRWTYGRVTKVKEDEAYCLLGLFNVFMPLAYGEGENAFRRLQKEIEDQTNSDNRRYTYTNWFGRPAAFKVLGLCLASAPIIQPEEFAGRAVEIDIIHDILRPNDLLSEQRRAVLGGKGGIGKTQLAIAYLRQYQQSYTSVLWLNATSELTLFTSLRLIAQELGAIDQGEQLDNDQVLAAVYGWLSHVENTKWLLVFDNYNNPESFDLDRLCANVGHGSSIVTSRVPDMVTGSHVRVEPMKAIHDGLDILQTRSGRADVHNDAGARCLVERMAGLPLALVSAGAYLRESSITFQQYLEAYERRWQADPLWPARLQKSEIQDQDSHQDRVLYTTWNLSYSRLEIDNPKAAQMLKLLAYFDRQEIWYEMFQAGLPELAPAWLYRSLGDQTHFESIMSTLVEYCLVEVQHTATGRLYSMHNCVHDWTLEALNQEIDAQLYWYAFDCVAASIDRNDWKRLGELRYIRISRHAAWLAHDRFTLCDQLNSSLSKHLDEATWIAQMLKEQVQLFAAEQIYTRALAGYEQAFGPDHTSTLDIVNNLGNLYADQGKLAQAEQMYLRALARYKQELGPNHTLTLRTMNNLSLLYADQGRLEEAEPMYLRVLAGYKQLLGANHTSTLRIISNLGLLYAKQGRLEKAEQKYRRVLARYKQLLGPNHTLTLRTIDNLGLLYADQGKPERAEQMYLTALAGYEQALGPSHTLTLRTIENLSILYAKQGKLERAEQKFQRVVIDKARSSSLSMTDSCKSSPTLV